MPKKSVPKNFNLAHTLYLKWMMMNSFQNLIPHAFAWTKMLTRFGERKFWSIDYQVIAKLIWVIVMKYESVYFVIFAISSIDQNIAIINNSVFLYNCAAKSEDKFVLV